MSVTLGIDVGGTRVKVGLVADDGALDHVRVVGVGPADRSEHGMVTLLTGLIEESRAAATVARVGIGIPGAVDLAAGVVTRSPNFPEWVDLDLRGRLRGQGLDLPLAIDNDANVVGVGESLFGAARGQDSFILLTLGTGVGGALRLGGRTWRGVHGMAAELGHLNLVPGGRPCGCGGAGCLEQYASSNGLRHEILENAIDLDDAEALAADPDMPRKLFDLAAHGDAAARAIWERFGAWLGLGIGSLLNVLDVPLVVLGGGLAGALPIFQGPLLAAVSHSSFPAIHQGLRVVAGSLGDAAGILGAAALAREEAR